MDERRAIIASQPGVADAAGDLPASASAVDRVLAAVLAGAALRPGVLFGPLQLLLVGGGLGALAIDGRVRQPGRDVARPRGFLDRETVPDAAWVGAPALPAALAAAVALVRTTSLTRIAAPAVELAKGRAEGRRKLLSAIGRRGAAAFSERAFSEELVAAFGRTSGGLLTLTDLAEPYTTAVPAGARVPWLDEARGVSLASTVHVVAAGDARGRFAVACYEDATDGGIELPALELVVPRLAAPVRRGETRIKPGDPRPSPAPIGVAMEGGAPLAALGRAGLAARDDVDELLGHVAEPGWQCPRGVFGVRRSREGARPIATAG